MLIGDKNKEVATVNTHIYTYMSRYTIKKIVMQKSQTSLNNQLNSCRNQIIIHSQNSVKIKKIEIQQPTENRKYMQIKCWFLQCINSRFYEKKTAAFELYWYHFMAQFCFLAFEFLAYTVAMP